MVSWVPGSVILPRSFVHIVVVVRTNLESVFLKLLNSNFTWKFCYINQYTLDTEQKVHCPQIATWLIVCIRMMNSFLKSQEDLVDPIKSKYTLANTSSQEGVSSPRSVKKLLFILWNLASLNTVRTTICIAWFSLFSWCISEYTCKRKNANIDDFQRWGFGKLREEFPKCIIGHTWISLV